MINFTDVFHGSEIGQAWKLHPSFASRKGQVQTMYIKEGIVVIVTSDKIGVYRLSEDGQSYVLTNEVDL